MSQHPLPTYEESFAAHVGASYAIACWKGRVALYAVLKALGIQEGDEVILPGYTCVMAVNPVVYLAAKPVFVDIEPDTFNMDPARIEALISDRTQLIIVQHTYGFPADMDAISEIAARRSIPIVEDCCLALGSRYGGRPVGAFGVAAFWSSQWNKSYTTGLGGMATTSDPGLAQRIRTVMEQEAVSASRVEVMMLRMQLLAYRTLVYPRTTALAQRAFRWLSKTGMVVGSSSCTEFSPQMPDGFVKNMSALQARQGIRQLKRFDRSAAHRQRLKTFYDELLTASGWKPLAPSLGNDPVLVRYPVRVSDKLGALRAAASHGIELGSWFECPLHPIETQLDVYGYTSGLCPVAERASAEVVNLPLHPRVSEATAQKTVNFLKPFGPVDGRS